ncbi:hypothetical protein V2J09_000867 [Rumex salicifolius]
MDDVGFSPNSSFCGDLDIDFMDRLLDDGCWLQTADGSKFLHSPPSTPDPVGFPCDISLLPAVQQESENLPDLASTRTFHVDIEAANNQGLQSHDPIGSQDLSWEACEQNRIWIAPKADAGPSSSVKDRLMMAVRHFQALTRERDLLIQIWVPVMRGKKNFLTTVEQPYSYDPDCAPLVHYRNVSEGYHFCADEDSKEGLGLPGRVFLGKFPEWTPDVRLFRLDEYPRVNYALMCDVRGSVALPVFEIRSGSCVGVVEIITTTQKINYRPEVESVCKALEAVNLRSSEIISPFQEKVESDVYDIELSEIMHILRTICDKHSLSLGQTWAPCTQHKKGGCWRLDKDNCCISTIDSACYVYDQRVCGFHEACYEQHLFKDQGIVGKAFITNELCYAADVTECSKGEYPLSHHAKMFGLSGAFALRLGCLHGARRSYVLEFFLPIDCHDPSMTLHSEIMESLRMEVQGCRSLCFPSAEAIEQEPEFTGNELSFSEGELGEEYERFEPPSCLANISDAQWKGKGVAFPFNICNNDSREEVDVSTPRSVNEGESCKPETFTGTGNTDKGTGGTDVFESSIGDSCSLGTKEKGEKKKTKMQRSISLKVLKQYFSGSLKDAAKSIGVCPTTLKRICRQHGIARWPSRKIKKVDHSLRKLQHVIDTVHGAQGSIQISSFYSNFPELQSPITMTGMIKGQTEKITTCITSSSSQTSSSSHSVAATEKMSPLAANASGSGDPVVESCCLKKARSEEQLLQVSNNSSTRLGRSHSVGKQQQQHLIAENPSASDLALAGEGRKPDLRDGPTYKVKANFGEDKIRLKLAPHMGFGDLQREIAARFSKGDVSWMQIKYLDDDNEWVLLTCDADLEECVDIHRSSGNDMIRLLVHQTTSTLGGDFGGCGKSS